MDHPGDRPTVARVLDRVGIRPERLGRATMDSVSDRVQVRRIYDDPADGDGTRVLVDRLWPRGVSKERARPDEWCKQAAPSHELRTWYGHDPTKFDEFSRRYRDELEEGEGAEALDHLRRLAAQGTLTPLTATKAFEISEAAVLDYLLGGAASRPPRSNR